MSRLLARRPTLLPALRRLWRGTHRLQLGTDPGRAVMLDLTDPACARILDLLDGARTEAAIIRAAARHGITPPQVTQFVTALRQAGLVFDADTVNPGPVATRGLADRARHRLEFEGAGLVLTGHGRSPGPTVAARLRRRLAAQVVVSGASQLAVPIAATLASSGIGHLEPDVTGVTHIGDAVPAGLLPTDIRRPRAHAAADAVRRAAPDAAVGPLRPGAATFAVLVGFSAPASLTALSYGRRRLAHLAVSVRDGTVVVGPLVRPGASPCLNCLDLHRVDRDPSWPLVAAQLHRADDEADPVTATTALAAVAFAAAEVLTHIDGGEPVTVGATVEITHPGQYQRRRWSLHPACGCRRRQRSRPTEPPGDHTECFN